MERTMTSIIYMYALRLETVVDLCYIRLMNIIYVALLLVDCFDLYPHCFQDNHYPEKSIEV